MLFDDTRPLKRAKRRVMADLYDFLTFPSAGDAFSGGDPFRTSVNSFLSQHARVTFPSSMLPCLMTWQILFRVGDLVDGPDLSPVVVALDIVEEDVTRSSRSVYCDQCRVVGWSGHPVCKKRYHFIIRAESSSSSLEGYHKSCTRCGNLLCLSESSCKCCNSAITADDLEAWVYNQFEDCTHLLHGVVHSNGHGHLLTLNGREGGSKFLSGYDIMNFWDRLCGTLAVRKVSVIDASKKFGIEEYRLLHAITKGHSWYGNWGYEFGSGCYGLTPDAYQKAVHTLSSMPLYPLLFDGRRPRTCLRAIIAFYQSHSDTQLLTLKDLFSLLLRMIHETHKSATPTTPKKLESNTKNVLCIWTRDDVEQMQQAMIKVIKAATGGGKWVSRRALKAAMCKSGTQEFLDYCLKHLGGRLTGDGMVVRDQYNPTFNAVEFRLEPLSFVHCGTDADSIYPSREQIINDLEFLYESLFRPENTKTYRPQETWEPVIDSVTKLFDCKKFMKVYKTDKMTGKNPFAINLWCHVELSDAPSYDPAPPPELVVLPSSATVADLKNEATLAFQEVYAMFKRFQAEELMDYGNIEDSFTLNLLVGSSGSVRVKGTCRPIYGLDRFRMERGTENWTVDCVCGAKDDDGERMLACDKCGVWQHTRCAGIDNSDGIPVKYVCTGCSYSKQSKMGCTYSKQSKMGCTYSKESKMGCSCGKESKIGCSYSKESKMECSCRGDSKTVTEANEEPNWVSLSKARCRDEAIAANSPRVETCISVTC